MTSLYRQLCKVVTMSFVLILGAQARGADSVEQLAFLQGVEAAVELQASPTASNAAVRWSASLRALAQSKAQSADMYLVDLALFNLDGELGVEWSCAASKRGKRFSFLMQRQLTAFADDNSCKRLALARNLDAQKLCASKKEFGRRVIQTRDVPQPDEDGACSGPTSTTGGASG
jgi:hypothetical protein